MVNVVSAYTIAYNKVDEMIEKGEDTLFERVFGHPPPMYTEEFSKYVVIPLMVGNIALSGIGAYSIIHYLVK